MAETNFKLNIKTQADTSGIAKTQEALEGLKKEADGVPESFGDIVGPQGAAEWEALKARINEAAGEVKQMGAAGEQAGLELTSGLHRAAKSKPIAVEDLLVLGGMAGTAMAAGLEMGQKVQEGLDRMAQRGGGIASFLNLDEAEWNKFKSSLEEITTAVEQSAQRMAKAMDREFGAALKKYSDQLADFMGEWQEASSNLDKSYSKQERQLQSELRGQLAENELQREQALLGANPEDAAVLNAGYDERAQTMKDTAAMRAQELREANARQQEEEAAKGVEAAAEVERQQRAEIKAAEEEKTAARRRLIDEGVVSDQQRAIETADAARADFREAQAAGDEVGQQRALQKMQSAGPGAQVAREEMRRGVTSFEQAQADESMTPAQRLALTREQGVMSQADQRAASARDQEAKAKDARLKAEAALGERREARRGVEAEGQVAETERVTRGMKSARKAAPAPAAAAESQAQLEAASQETAQAAQQVAATGTEVAGDVRQVAQAMLDSNNKVAGAVSELSRAVEQVNQQATRAAQMASAALYLAQQTQQQSRSFNR
jgi:hypothetical protein